MRIQAPQSAKHLLMGLLDVKLHLAKPDLKLLMILACAQIHLTCTSTAITACSSTVTKVRMSAAKSRNYLLIQWFHKTAC